VRLLGCYLYYPFSLIQEKITNADGYYEFKGLDAGAYTLNWYTSSYAPASLNTYYPVGGNVRSVSVGEDAVTTANFSYAPGGAIKGRVTGVGGAPLNDVYPYIVQRQPSLAQSSLSAAAMPNTRAQRIDETQKGQSIQMTNANGEYTITGLDSGTYEIGFFPNSPGQSSGYAVGTSGLITVTAPYTKTGVNISLVPGGSITGQVTAADTGDAIHGAWVYIEGAHVPLGWGYEIRHLYGSVTYQFSGLPPGSYRLHTIDTAGQSKYIPEYYNNQTAASSATWITVTASKTISNVNFVLESGAQVTGTVTDEWHMPIEYIRVQVLDLQDHVVASATTNWDGIYLTGPGLPAGDYRVRFLSRSLLWCNTSPHATTYYSDGAIIHLDGTTTLGNIDGVMRPLPPVLYLPMALR
jgi:protocatechuate 3,4-dioxygenase beta subunit